MTPLLCVLDREFLKAQCWAQLCLAYMVPLGHIRKYGLGYHCCAYDTQICITTSPDVSCTLAVLREILKIRI